MRAGVASSRWADSSSHRLRRSSGLRCRAGAGVVVADQAPGRVEQRAARVARVDRGVGLDHAADLALVDRADLAVERADDAGGQRLVEPEGIADRVDLLADLQVAAEADRQGLELVARRADAQHGEVAVGKRAHQFGLPLRLVGERDARAARSLDDVEIGDDVPAVVPDEAAAGAARHPGIV